MEGELLLIIWVKKQSLFQACIINCKKFAYFHGSKRKESAKVEEGSLGGDAKPAEGSLRVTRSPPRGLWGVTRSPPRGFWEPAEGSLGVTQSPPRGLWGVMRSPLTATQKGQIGTLC